MAITTTLQQVEALYIGYFGRAGEPAGTNYWVQQISSGALSLSAVAASFSVQAEAKAAYPSFLADPTSIFNNPSTFVDAIYQNLFNRAPDAPGKAYWVAELTANKGDAAYVGNFILSVINGAFGPNGSPTDAATIDNKVAAGAHFTQALADNGISGTHVVDGKVVMTAEAAAAAKNAVGPGVTSDVTSIANANAASDAFAANGPVGPTFTLTTAADVINGTSGNDKIIGSGTIESTNGTFSATTYNTADQINGGAGSDTISLTIDGALKANTVTAINAPSISNVETLNIRNVAGTTGGTEAVSADASLIPGLTAFNSDRSTNTVTVTNLASGASAGMIGDGNVTNGALNAGYVGGATAATINVSGGTKAGAITVTGTGLTSTLVTSKGAANTIGALTGAASNTSTTIDATTNLTTGAVTNAGATLTVKGAGAVNLSATALQAGVTKLDASAHTGGLTVALGSAATQVVTAGSGNDVITSGATLTTGSVDGGAGIDTLVLSSVAHANTAALAAKYTNFETLRVNGTFDASLISGITAIELSGATNNISKLSVTQAAAITTLANIGATTLSLASDVGASDVITLNLGNGKGAAFNTGALTVNGVETLNLKANAKGGDADQTSVIDSLVGDKLTAINLTGAAFTLSDAATAKATTINASALTGTGGTPNVGLILSGNLVTGSTVIGSGANDTFTVGTGFATYNGGAGNDTFNATAAELNTGANYNVINGGDGVDTLNIMTGGISLDIVDNNLSKVTNVEKIVVATTGVNNQSIQTGGFFDAAFKTSGVDLTTTSGNGNITIDMTSFTGAVTLTTTSTTGVQSIQTGTAGGADKISATSTTGNVTVVTGTGDDVVTVTTGAATNSISTGAGNDTITVVGAATLNTINAGTGADKITLGGGVDKVVIGNTDSGITIATADLVTGFTSGTDKINFGFIAADGTNFKAALAAVTTFDAALTAANADFAALKLANPLVTEFASFQKDATTGYLFNDVNGDGVADQVVVLAGVTTFIAADLTTA